MVKKDDKMKFITLFNKLQYERPVDDEMSTESFADYLIDDIDLKKMAPERLNYYKDLIAIFNKRPQLLYNILKKYYRFQDIKEKEKKYINKLSYYGEGEDGFNLREFEEYMGEDILNKSFKKITRSFFESLRDKVAEQKVKQSGGNFDDKYKESKFRNVLKRDYGITNVDNLRESIYTPKAEDNEADNQKVINNMEKRYKTQNKLVDIGERIDMFNDGDLNKTDIKYDIKKFENDPDNPLKELEITFDDRLVFIFSTFFIRYITLVLVKWSIDINIIKTFEEGFYYYAAIYLTIFWFIVLFVNIDNSTQVDYMNFDDFMNSIRSVFYYYYMGTNGVTRLLIHSVLIVILLMIPVILNIRKKNDFDEDEENNSNILNYEERKKLIKSLSLFTIYIWILTSIIATKF
jgi:hypothetical protein